MKLKHLIPGALICCMFVACSNDDELTTGNEPGDGEKRYLAVNICTSSTGPGVRAASDFETGTPTENKADKGMFLFFDGSGNPTQTPQTVNLDWTNTTINENPAVEKISQATIIIAGNTAPAQMLVILNAPAGMNLNNKSLSQVRDIVDQYDACTEGTFIITNSTYQDESGEDVNATAIDASQLYGTREEATAENANKVNVYVERVVAKVETNAIGDSFSKGAEIEINGQKITLTQDIEGIEIANIAQTSYLFKNIDGISGWTGFNDFGNKRSYWATCPQTMTYGNLSWNNISGETHNPTQNNTFYIQENTTDQKTAVLVTATLKANGEAKTFLKWAGNYYLKEGFIANYAAWLQAEGYEYVIPAKEDEESHTSDITVDMIDWLSAEAHATLVADGELEGYEMTVCLKDEYKDYTFLKNKVELTAEGKTSFDLVNEFLLEDTNRVWLWEDGKAYYFVNIKHSGNSAPFNEGVVRNHVYKLDLQSLKGVGVPVFNPDEEIVPKKPVDELFYLAAEIDILKWKIVNQEVNFE